jgi:uncharacterized membrane protein
MDILSRWLHIVTAATAVGGLLYARLVVTPALAEMSAETRAALTAKMAARLRPVVWATIVVALVSGVYNFFARLSLGVAPAYHIVFGIKFLAALHVFAILLLLSGPPSGDPQREAKRGRWLTGAVISGLVIVALGAYLRTLHV